MDDLGYLPLLLGLIVLPILIVLPFVIVARVVRRLGGGSFGGLATALGSGFTGGWRQLADVYATDRRPPAGLLTRATVMVGAVTFKRIVSVGADAGGLYLALDGFPYFGRERPLAIPWQDLAESGTRNLYWRTAHVFAVGRPPVGTLTVLPEVDALMRPWLRGAAQDAEAPAAGV